MYETELETTNGRGAGLNVDEDAFVVLKPAGIVGGCGCYRSAKLCVDEWGLRLSWRLVRRPAVGSVGRGFAN
jgi:hypothetical protein